MVGWHNQLNGHEFKQTPGDSEGEGSLDCRQGAKMYWTAFSSQEDQGWAHTRAPAVPPSLGP